ncbi:MAG TPA: energy transducer TonB [bacterium]|jgi:hypothetical protein
MNKYSKTILGAAIVTLITVAGSLAGTPENGSQVLPNGYIAPQLLMNVRPEPVEYLPGRLIEGYVTLEIRVGQDGIVKSANVIYKTSSLAVASAIHAVAQWRFAPATLDGHPTDALVAYSLPFGQNLSIFANANYPDKIWNPNTGELITMK